jgi:hypothetical protein
VPAAEFHVSRVAADLLPNERMQLAVASTLKEM